MLSTLRENENKGNSKLRPDCAEIVERVNFLWKGKENEAVILLNRDLPG